MELTISAKTENQDLENYFGQIAAGADHAVRYFIFAFFAFGICIAPIYDTWIFALGIGGSALVAYFVCLRFAKGTFLSRLVNSVIFSFFMLQFIAQMHGMYEMHFFFFINIAILIIYQDWRIMVPYTIIAVAHHSVFFMLQLQGYDTGKFFIGMDGVTWVTLFFHFGLAITMAVVCGWWSIILHKRTMLDYTNKSNLERQLKNMKRNIQFAEEISKGNLDIVYSVEEGDELGKSLLNMQAGLMKAKEKEDAEHFRTKGLAELGVAIRKSNNNPEAFSQAAISKMALYTGALAGNLYLVEEVASRKFLKLQGSFAYSGKDQGTVRFSPGEGLVGQVYLEKKTLHLTTVPENYLEVGSGMGASNAKALLMVPVRYEDQIVGIVELASIKPFQQQHIEFIEKAGEDLAIILISNKNNKRAEHLMQAYKQQAEAMQLQEQKMHESMEELSKIQRDQKSKKEKVVVG